MVLLMVRRIVQSCPVPTLMRRRAVQSCVVLRRVGVQS
jgi:hypothetical protein